MMIEAMKTEVSETDLEKLCQSTRSLRTTYETNAFIFLDFDELIVT